MTRILYHFPLCPRSRLVRVLLHEQKMEIELREEPYWERRESFARMNPAFETPVLAEHENMFIPEASTIWEYLEETYSDESMMPGSPANRVEIRRIALWFTYKFHREVTEYILEERIIRFLMAQGEPNSEVLRAAKANVSYHLDYITFLLKHRKWLAGDSLSLADIAAATQLSVLDYLGDIWWENYPTVKEWYVLIKSRPSFRSLLNDRIPGFTPHTQYSNLDF